MLPQLCGKCSYSAQTCGVSVGAEDERDDFGAGSSQAVHKLSCVCAEHINIHAPLDLRKERLSVKQVGRKQFVQCCQHMSMKAVCHLLLTVV